jgi:hypothetical protein
MKRLTIAAITLGILSAVTAVLLPPALAQCNGVFPNNTVCGNITGSGNLPRPTSPTAFQGSAGGSNGQIQYNNAGALAGFTASGDATVNTGTGVVSLVVGAANTIFGTLNGTTKTNIAVPACATALQYTAGVGFTCASASESAAVIPSRASAITLDLSSYTAVQTQGYATPGDGGGATFVKIGSGTQFKDSFITAGSLTSGGVTCPNGSYTGVQLVQGTGRGAYASVTVAGTVVTAVTLTAAGNQYTVGDVLTGGLGCGTDWTWTVSAVSTPLASFTDAAGNKWQYLVNGGSFVDPRAFGAKFDCTSVGLTCDATATDDFASIQAALFFANYHGSSTLNSDTPTGYSTRVVLPFGSAKVCVSGTAFSTLVVPDSVVLEGQAKFGSWLKQCDSDGAADYFVTLGWPQKTLACFGPQLRNMGLYAGTGNANHEVAMIFTNCAQQGIAINDVAVYSIFRMCLRANTGWGGASDFTLNGLECNINYQAPNQTEIIEVNYNGATIKLHDIILESGSNISIRGISIINVGGTVNIQNFHAEQISLPIWFNAVSPSTVGVVAMGLTGGNGCSSLVTRVGGSVANRITLGTAVKAACTNTYDNAGAATTTDVYNWVNF